MSQASASVAGGIAEPPEAAPERRPRRKEIQNSRWMLVPGLAAVVLLFLVPAVPHRWTLVVLALLCVGGS